MLKYSQGVRQGCGLISGLTREKSSFKLIQAIGRIQFLRVVELRASISFSWLSTRGHSQLPETSTVLTMEFSTTGAYLLKVRKKRTFSKASAIILFNIIS